MSRPRQTPATSRPAFQTAVGDVLCNRTANAMEMFVERTSKTSGDLVVAGGVAANRYLGDRLKETAANAGFRLMVPPPVLCTDNAVMIAWAGIERRRAGLGDDPLNAPTQARWPLDPIAARPGAKA